MREISVRPRAARPAMTSEAEARRSVAITGAPHPSMAMAAMGSQASSARVSAMASWSGTGCEGRKANVEVYARAARVGLVLNGHTVGSKTLKNDCLARFSIPYESGTLEAVSYDAADHEIGRCKLQSAGGTTRLTLDAEEPAAQMGHLCYVRLRYTDENGITKPLMRGNIQVQVRGGTLVGLGSACPFNKHSYLDSETDTYYGEALAIVRMGDGDAMTIAASDGEYSAELTVPAQA